MVQNENAEAVKGTLADGNDSQKLCFVICKMRGPCGPNF